MFTKVKNLVSRFRRDEEGVTLVEYGIALTLAVGVGGFLLTTLAADVSAKMGEASVVLAPQP